MSAPTLGAVVVAGGSARRMGGVDKLCLDVGGRTLLDAVLAAALPLCTSLVVVGPRRPTGIAGVRFVTEVVTGGGPVPAVAAGMAELDDGATAVLVLAGDLPLLATEDLRRLVAALGTAQVTAAAAVDDNGRPHPLVAVHRIEALADRLAGFRLMLEGLPAARLLPPDVATVALRPEAVLNVNCPADLERARSVVDAQSARRARLGATRGGSPGIFG